MYNGNKVSQANGEGGIGVRILPTSGIEGGPKASLIGDWGISKSPVARTGEVLDGRREVRWGFWMVGAIIAKIVCLDFFPRIVAWWREEDTAKSNRGSPCFHKGVKYTHPWAA